MVNSSFKDMLASDLDSVFFNLDEFASYEQIDGRSLQCIIRDESLKERSSTANYEGFYNDVIFLYISESVLGFVPKKDLRMNINGKNYTVDHTISSAGLLTVTLSRNAT